jgi:hypothetical protein
VESDNTLSIPEKSANIEPQDPALVDELRRMLNKLPPPNKVKTVQDLVYSLELKARL